MTNCLIGYPDIPKSTSLGEPSMATGYNARSVVTGSRGDHVKLVANGTTATYEWDYGANTTPAYLYVARADLVRKADSAATTWTVTGSASSSFTSPDTKTGTFNTSDLKNPRSEDLITTFTYSSAYRYWRARLTTTASIKHEFSKIYLGSWFDFGREPVANVEQTRRAASKWARATAFAIRLQWRGISDSLVNSLNTKIVQYRDTNPVILYDAGDIILGGYRVIHARISDVDVQLDTYDSNSVSIEFEELI